MSARGEPAVRCQGLVHAYGRLRALDSVDLAIPAGALVGFVGPDGVGKSTLLALIAGAKRLQSGRLEVLGLDPSRRADRARLARRIAYMPQGLGRNLYPTLSVARNLAFFASLHGLEGESARRRIALLSEATGLASFLDRPAGKLSGGMKQKLALACALVHDPDLLILDEPTTGVDPLSRRRFFELLAAIRAARPAMTVLFATAYMAEAERFDRVVAIDAGRILGEGPPALLCARTGTARLDEAFVALLPPERRRDHRPAERPPRRGEENVPPVIEARGLGKRFGAFTAVDRVSFSIGRGEIFGFLGSNGCGKTTTMKMLVGLLEPSSGEAFVLGEPAGADSLAARRRIGYMSQSFSLYEELTVRQNLELHAAIYGLPRAERGRRVAEQLARFELAQVADRRPPALPLGLRQRLQLAVATLHEPEILILDEPTSGVDPIARDRFWALLIELARTRGVTIFLSTHFMDEALRCDRISLMHAGRVLAVGEPGTIAREHGQGDLETAFVELLAAAEASERAPLAPSAPTVLPEPPPEAAASAAFSPARLLAFSRREGAELLADPVRLAFALLGPIVLLLAMGFGISFDVENLRFAVLDQDRTAESRAVVRALEGSRYFEPAGEPTGSAEADRLLEAARVALVLAIPPGFGRDLVAGRQPELAVWLDGANTTRAETARGYVLGVVERALRELAPGEAGTAPFRLETRFRYNQEFRSTAAIPPGVMMMQLVMIPAMLGALAVVREKELGSIVNLYTTPATRLEFLIGKQLPYIATSLASFLSLLLIVLFVFDNRLRGDPATLALGALLFVSATTAFGLVVSAFVRSQIAAIFATAILCMIPTVNFSGMLYPVATLDAVSRAIGQSFPALYFQRIVTGVVNKGLGLDSLWPDLVTLAGFVLLFWVLAVALLPEQER
ncbi:MAG: ribosome-associated ATPase/putative transporter RbbA [Geminicoccaceae bacterium]|nr:ribosome-associated ATPase/putative transporter RbbA [Geminicoccaceae bacterium]MDW8369942.1 ribosome-associated ATPase/putative transporter RbbA [Geminicoccaceae bacterium]